MSAANTIIEIRPSSRIPAISPKWFGTDPRRWVSPVLQVPRWPTPLRCIIHREILWANSNEMCFLHVPKLLLSEFVNLRVLFPHIIILLTNKCQGKQRTRRETDTSGFCNFLILSMIVFVDASDRSNRWPNRIAFGISTSERLGSEND